MKHIVVAAYKDAHKALRQDMMRRMAGMPAKDEEEEDMQDTSGNHPELPEGSLEEESGESPAEEKDELTDQEKKRHMYGAKKPPPKGGVMVVIGMGKGKKGKK